MVAEKLSRQVLLVVEIRLMEGVVMEEKKIMVVEEEQKVAGGVELE